ncbi:MAG TPA: fibronectin type III domain-containing protein [Chitinophagaceae bacterium]|nr:fibronectin type III domain-containing protein [Chitinophagaceae bacterium]
MKKSGIQHTPIPLLLIVIALGLASSCQKSLINKFTSSRMFTPTTIKVSGGDTAVTISWPASLNAPVKGVTYTVEISTDSTFQTTPALSLKVDTIAVRVTDDTLQDRQPYFVRVKANQTGDASDSYWLKDTVRFSLVGVQIFHPLMSSDIIDNAVIFHWTTSPGVSEIILTAAGGDTIQVPVTEADNTAGKKMVDNLVGGTAYTAQILSGRKSKGLLMFSTKSPQTGANVIDLREKTDPLVLSDTLPVIPSGSIVLLKRGMTYDMDSYVIDKTVTIMSGLGFGSPAALSLSGNFDASGDLDSIRFSDLTIVANGSNYFMNISKPANIGKMSIVNCTTQGEFSNSFIRMKKAGDKISLLYIDHCVIDSFGVGAKYALLYANASSSALFDRVEIRNSTFYYFYYFIRQDKVSTQSILIDHCTFDNMINQGGYFIKYSTYPPSFDLSNCIFGKTLDPTNANGIESSAGATLFNCYLTSDCVFSGSPITGGNAYSGTSADLFTDPAKGDFNIKDGGFAGKGSAGDPRWR